MRAILALVAVIADPQEGACPRRFNALNDDFG